VAYDAFISYSHAADARLAPALQRALQRFAKPWWKLRALNLFRDETSLAAASSLTGALLGALDSSRFFVFLASPRAAASKWCNEEIAHWLRNRSPDTLLIVLSEGAVAWDEAAGDFDWQRTDALPPALKGALPAEPFWLDLSWARQDEQLSARDPRFLQVVARLAATLHGRSLEDISGEDVRQHRVTRRVATAASAAILALAVGAGVAAWEATRARDEADRQRIAAQRSEAEARTQRDQAEKALARTLEATDTLVLEIAEGMKDFAGVPRARLRGVLEKAEKILDSLPADGDAPAIRRRRFDMSLVLADALIALGDTDQAYRRARDAHDIARELIARKPDEASLRNDLASTLVIIGDVLTLRGDRAGAAAAFEESRALRARLLEQDPQRSAWQIGLMTSLDRLGDVSRAQGDLARAQAAFEECLDLSERQVWNDPVNMARRRDWAILLGKLGDVLAARGDLAGAMRRYEAALPISRQLTTFEPANTDRRRDLALALERIGQVHLARGEFDAALVAYRESAEIARHLAGSDPRNVGWQRDLAIAALRIGDVHMERADTAEAEKAFAEARAVAARLVRLDPANAQSQRDLATYIDRIGDARVAAGDLAGATGAYDEARSIRTTLLERDPHGVPLLRDVAAGLHKLGDVRLAGKDAAGALGAYREALRIVEELARVDAADPQAQYGLFLAYDRIARGLAAMPGRLGEARDMWKRSTDVAAALAAAGRLEPRNERYVDRTRRSLADAETRLAAGER